MCGRYVITIAPDDLRTLLGYQEQPNFPARYNVAPTQPVPIIRVVEGERHFALVRWGLVPTWVKDPRAFSLIINARGETVLDKPAFRHAIKRRRCLVPANGFYEWRRDGDRKRPCFVRLRSGQPMIFAGLWETWMGPNGEEVDTMAIVTTIASRSIAHIHDRMPVIVPPDAFAFWLDCANVDAQSATAIIQPTPDDQLEAYEVSTAVNHTANDAPDLIAPHTAPTEPEPAPKRARKPKSDDGQASLF
jgi:putative SOS response-associated peptidase YedK